LLALAALVVLLLAVCCVAQIALELVTPFNRPFKNVASLATPE